MTQTNHWLSFSFFSFLFGKIQLLVGFFFVIYLISWCMSSYWLDRLWIFLFPAYYNKWIGCGFSCFLQLLKGKFWIKPSECYKKELYNMEGYANGSRQEFDDRVKRWITLNEPCIDVQHGIFMPMRCCHLNIVSNGKN